MESEELSIDYTQLNINVVNLLLLARSHNMSLVFSHIMCYFERTIISKSDHFGVEL